MIGLFEALAIAASTATTTAYLWLCFFAYLDEQGLTERQRLTAKCYVMLVMLIAVLLMFLVNVWVAPVILLAASLKFPTSKYVVQEFIVNPVKNLFKTISNDVLGLDKLDKFRYEVEGFEFYSDRKLTKVTVKRYTYSTKFYDENGCLIHKASHLTRYFLNNTTEEIEL